MPWTLRGQIEAGFSWSACQPYREPCWEEGKVQPTVLEETFSFLPMGESGTLPLKVCSTDQP